MRRTHHTNDHESDEQGSGATSGQSTARTNEETSADGSSNGNHVKMARLQALVELIVLVCERASLEGVGRHTQACHQPRPLRVAVVVQAHAIVAGLLGAGLDIVRLLGVPDIGSVHDAGRRGVFRNRQEKYSMCCAQATAVMVCLARGVCASYRFHKSNILLSASLY